MAESGSDSQFLEITRVLLSLVEEGDVTDRVTDQGPSPLHSLPSFLPHIGRLGIQRDRLGGMGLNPR